MLLPGTRLGSYEITAALGAGGMGEVYRARDSKLGREVAIKALPDAFAQDPERVARFEREAKLLASLNHSHIAQIYGLEEAASAKYLGTGREEPFGSEGLGYLYPRISLDGKRVALSLVNAQERDIYVYEVDRQVATRLTFGSAAEDNPQWSADGGAVMFRSDSEGGGIFRVAASGVGDVERLTTRAGSPFAVSPDGVLVFGETDPATRDDLYMLAATAAPSPTPLLQTPFDEEHAAISPDGRWLAYTTDEAGWEDIYVRPFPNVNDGKHRISTGGGREPLWGPRGGELFFRSSGSVMAVRIDTEPEFRASAPVVLFEDGYLGGGGVQYDIAPDGQRFLMIKLATAGDAARSPQIVVVQNWHSELQRLVPARR